MSKATWLDISFANGAVNWDAIEADFNAGNIGGVFIRAGYGTATGMEKDAQFDTNRQQAQARRIPRGFYGYAYPGRSSGAVQANGIAVIIGQLQPGEITGLDLEDDPTYGRMLVASDVQWAQEFEATLRDHLGPVPLTYMNSNVLSRYDFSPLVSMGSGLWQANYGANDGSDHGEPDPQEWPFNAWHQFTSQGNAGGIHPVDLSNFTGNPADAIKYGLSGEHPAPAPVPAPAPNAPAPVAGIGTSYVVGKDIPGYVNSTNAAARQGSNSTVPAGTYYVFNQANGAINITRQPGVPGWWINPGDNTIASAPPAPNGNFVVVKNLPGYYTAANAANHQAQADTVAPGNYFVFNTYQGMVNITSTHGVPGSWINPADNAGAPQNIPAAATHTVVKGDTVESISIEYGLSLANNYAQYRALNPNGGHSGDWTDIWPGDVVRVR